MGMRGSVSLGRLATAAALAMGGCGFINDVDGPTGLAIKKFSLSPREVTPGHTSTLSWDVDGADQVQIDNGEWQVWLGPTTATSMTYEAQPGHTYYFRSRAEDNAGNWEVYASADKQITIPHELRPNLFLPILTR